MWVKNIIFFLLYNTIESQMIFPDSKLIFSNNEMPNYESGYSSNVYANSINVDGGRKLNDISRGLNNFALNINKMILNNQREPITENIVLSPLSIAGALSLVTLGSVGKTYAELAKVLGFFNDLGSSMNVHHEFGRLLNKINDKKPSYEVESRNLSYANGLFIQNNYPIRQQYENIVRSVYKSDLVQVDFQYDAEEAKEMINKWVYDQTNGKIKNILNNTPSRDTKIIVANALYFAGEWEKYFIDGLTKRILFMPDLRYPEKSTFVDMMANEGTFPFYKSDEHECMILGLPYKGNKTTLYAIKPINSARKNLKQLMNDLTADTINMLIANAQRQSTIVLFPKTKLTSTYNLKDILRSMGVQSLFSSVEANLGLISSYSYSPNPNKNIYQDRNDNEQRLIFSRFGNDIKNTVNCTEIFESKNPSIENCSSEEMINGQKVRVLYKKIGNQIGRKIIKRNIMNRHLRQRRQIETNVLNPGLFVDEIVHKVDIDITETGTEAAAATLAFVTRDGRRPVFRADEPFYFIIMDDETNFPLFSSLVYNP